jgi:multiple sugar transport system permease protein
MSLTTVEEVETTAPKVRARKSHYRTFIWWLAPILGLLLIFWVIPILGSIFLSFFDYKLNQPLKFVGLENFIYSLERDQVFLRSLVNTAYYASVSVIIGIACSLLVAQFIFSRTHLVSFLRTVYFLPVVTPFIAIVIVWRFILQPSQFGFLNGVFASIGIPAQPWLTSAKQVIPSLIVIGIWSGLGYNMVLFLAGLGGIPTAFYEAAKIDGANSWQMFWKITWPLLSPTVLFITVTGTIGALQVFGVPYILTKGGPEDSSRMVVMWIQQTGFDQFRMGYASALAMIFFLIILALTLFQLRYLRTRWSY